MHKNHRALSVVLFAIFLDLVSYGILVPVVPQFFANPDSAYYMLDAGVSLAHGYIYLGFLIAIFPILQFFSAPILGQYSDIHGRRKVLTLSLAGTAASFIIFALGISFRSISLLFISRALGGILGGNISVAQAAIADITKPSERAKHFGLIGAAYGAGFIIGPVLGGILSDSSVVSWFTLATPFWVAAIFSGLNALFIYTLMGETRSELRHSLVTWTKSIHDIIRAYGMKTVRAVFVTNFFFQAGITFVATFFSVYLIDRFHMGQVGIGYYIGYAGIWIIISQAVLVPWLSRRYEEVTLLRWSLILGTAGIFSFYLPHTILGLLIAGACFALTNGISMATLPSLASRRAPAHIQGEILGINTSIQALAQAIPPILSGYLAATIAPSAPVYIAGIAVGLGWILFVTCVKK